MSDRSKIEWTDATWNPVRAFRPGGKMGWHCEHVSEGCRNCYAERINLRLGTGYEYTVPRRPFVDVFLDEKALTQPLHWRRPRRIFVGSMTDLFADFVTDDMLDRIFAVMALCQQHTFQLLTKRPARMRSWLTATHPPRRDPVETLAFDWLDSNAGRDAAEDWIRAGMQWPLPNVWLGTSVENQDTADDRIPHLLDTPAAIRFVSYEPALGPVDFTSIQRRFWARGQHMNALTGAANPSLTGIAPTSHIDWLIMGGESGPGARPMHPDWARSVRDQCAAAGVAFFFKQHGEWAPIAPLYGDNDEYEDAGPDPDRDVPVDRNGSQWDDGAQPPSGTWMMRRVGKKRAGRLLDGREHNDMPGGAR